MIAVEREHPTSEALLQGARRELVDRVLASASFAKSKRLSSLLAYLCELTLSGRAADINEQRVGEDVFDRRPDYDSMVDGIVRTQASRLRQKLDQYFSEEGAHEPIRITIPRGCYVPAFEPRPDTKRPEEPLASEPMEPHAPMQARERESARSSPGTLFAWCALLITTLCLGIVLVRDRAIHSQSTFAVPDHLLWSKLFEPDQRTLVIPGDSSLVIWQGLKNRNIDLNEYVSGTYRTAKPANVAGVAEVATDLASRRYTSIVDLEATQALSRIATRQRSAIEVRYPREIDPNDLKQGNLIVIGTAEADPWVTLFERNMDFVFTNDRVHHVFRLLNRSPRNSEPQEWDFVAADREHRVYSVVGYVPNLSGNGHVLLLEGTTMAGTQCAWDFVADDSRLLPFLQRIQKPDGSLPYFELVLETNSVNGSAVESTILTYRVSDLRAR